MNHHSIDCTICDTDTDGFVRPAHKVELPPTCEGNDIENFRGRRGGRRGGRGGWRRGYRNWGGGYRGFGYYPYWYGSHYYWPTYYDYPYVARQPVLTGVVKPSSSSFSNTGMMTFTVAMIALIVAFFALRK